MAGIQESVCGSCHARLVGADGLAPVFAVYPSGLTVCFRCLQRTGEHVCPVTGRDFRARPAAAGGEIRVRAPGMDWT